MTNHSRQIFPYLLEPPEQAPHRIIPPLLLLLLSTAAATPYTTAPMSTDTPSSSSPDYAYSNANPSPSIFIVVLASAFFAVYIRQCIRPSDSGGSTATSGLNPEVIDSFLIFPYSEVKYLKIGIGSALECAVCISEFENHETLRLIPKCHHVFHFECIDFWLASHSTCPVCRADLVPKPGKTESTHSVHEQSIRSEPGEAQNQNQYEISIDIGRQA